MDPTTAVPASEIDWRIVGPLIAATAGWAAAIAGWLAYFLNRKTLQRLRAEDVAKWHDAFVRYRRDHLKPFAETIRVAYERFVGTRAGLPATWEEAVHAAKWLKELPTRPGFRLQNWRTTFGIGLDHEDEFLLQFCEAIYSPFSRADSRPIEGRSILSSSEFELFDKARGGMADYFHQCGLVRDGSREFAAFLEGVVRENHYYKVKLLSYLEVALVRAIGESSETGSGKRGLFELGHLWSVDDRRA